ncbi:VOC family protein [Asticcacaulis sp. EMRT-3]|uniref:VOC family protein n=1 Tax=Asticcacaulis sp. EMRT-3 TaxID=3040349 RepID=UPI0024AFD3B6|nr:VOC family protein [Asticcacaulis sp. EMRT-3]MDI7775557.1 VOC family protein [Asticcacaulis sp. EMRT-3]
MITSIIPHLAFDGTCAEAFAFYVGVLGGEITFMMTMGESPMADQVPVEQHGAIMHATIKLGDGLLIMGADAPSQMYHAPAGTSVNLTYPTVEEGARVFKGLSEGGHEYMAFGETFWSKGFGMCIDRFGQHWMVNCGEVI